MNFVKRSTTTLTVSCPLSDLGKAETKSIMMCFHFHLPTSNGCIKPVGFQCSAFTCQQVKHLKTNKAAFFFFASTKTGDISHGTFSFLQDELQVMNDETHEARRLYQAKVRIIQTCTSNLGLVQNTICQPYTSSNAVTNRLVLHVLLL